MAITTYSTLQSAAADWLNRTDIESAIQTFITLAEAKLNRELRVRDMITRTTAGPSTEFVSLPSDFLQVYRLENAYDSPRSELRYVPPQDASRYSASGYTSGTLNYYTITGPSIQLIPAPSSAVTLNLTYYASIPALSNSNTSNWLLVKSPDLYLYSTLLEAGGYLRDDQIQLWSAARQQVIDAMQLEGERAMRPTTDLVARHRSFG